VRSANEDDFKLVMVPGDRILEITRPRLGAPGNSPPLDPQFEALVQALTLRGVRESDARRTLFEIDHERQNLMDQIEWFDDQSRKMGAGMLNPPGFLLTAIRENWPVPPGFESSRKRELRGRLQQQRGQTAEGVAEAQRALNRMEIEERYRSWIDDQVDRVIERQFSAAQVQTRLAALKRTILNRHPGLYSLARQANQPCPALEEHALRLLRQEVRDALQLPGLEEFSAKPQDALF